MWEIFGLIAKPLGYLLTGIYSVVGNYGITLIIFTVIVRLCLFPLYVHQTKSSLRMAEVQPKIQALQKKYANDKEELNRRMMEFYKEEGVNPMKGCLPMLIQMPIMLGLFTLLRDPMSYLPEGHANMILAVHEQFFWISDLSQPDLWALPIMAGITTFLSFSATQAQNSMGAQANANQMAGMMKMMKYFFPVMIVWMGRSFPAGLTLYWFIGNICSIIQFQTLKLWKKRLERMKAEGKDVPLSGKGKGKKEK
ncbi:MAG: YidC/Oxa1 family membrane protein insertase [Clostridiales Family XIII bacterium]|jgi:YidC/Oxa1 family membrane protein insertase|nr:YidC/Oxa1 family membrane protein insertase [Clostridiales Family XIII bacterium]